MFPHWCHGSAQAAFSGSEWASLADTYGFIVLYPDSPNLEPPLDKCWDVSSPQTLSHNGGGDSLGIISAVRWAVKEFHADVERIFVSGVSSGAMMTNVLLGSYPDVFAAGAALAGVAFGCFANPTGFDVWSNECATGQIIKTGKEWAEEVYAAYMEYKGFRPKMQVWHGTEDTVLYPQNLQEEIKQWTSVFGYSEVPLVVTESTPVANWTKFYYGEKFEAYKVGGVTHNIPKEEAIVMKWFDLACEGLECYSRTNSKHEH